MVVAVDVPHLIEVPHPYGIEITSETIIEVHTLLTTDEAPHTNDVEVTLHVDRHVIVAASIDPYVHTCGVFFMGPLTLLFSDVVIPLKVKAVVEECGMLPLVDCLLTMLKG